MMGKRLMGSRAIARHLADYERRLRLALDREAAFARAMREHHDRWREGISPWPGVPILNWPPLR